MNYIKHLKIYRVNLYYNTSPKLQTAYPTGNGTHAGYLQYKDGKGDVVHNIHGTVHVDPLDNILGGNQKEYGVLNIYEGPGDYNINEDYRQRLSQYVSKNPMGIGTEDSENVRNGLRKNYPEDLQNYWNSLTEQQKKSVNKRFKP